MGDFDVTQPAATPATRNGHDGQRIVLVHTLRTAWTTTSGYAVREADRAEQVAALCGGTHIAEVRRCHSKCSLYVSAH